MSRMEQHTTAAESEHRDGDDHGHEHHHEAEENEIAGPVLFALTILTLIIVIIYFWAQ